MSEPRTPPPREQEPAPLPRPPRVPPTNPATLVVLGLGSMAVAWILVANAYGDMPAIPWLPAFTIFALAAFEAFVARNTKARIDRRPNTAPVDVLVVARYVVLAKASSPAGATPTATGLVASLALVGAALWLERSCRVPKPPEDDKPAE
ncbi:MAG: DUF3180 domain-containing protein [Actinobacteria bacterium]|nr:MAG: DUF3180 domain-containing protein [Actinomycetota bacterium]